MSTVAAMSRKLDNLILIDEVVNVISDEKDMLKQTIKQQWKEGRRGDGSPIGQYQNKYYAQKKNSMNPLPGFGFMDLILTGKTINSLDVDTTRESIIFKLASDENDVMRYGEDILGINPQSRPKVSNVILVRLLDLIRERTGAE